MKVRDLFSLDQLGWLVTLYKAKSLQMSTGGPILKGLTLLLWTGVLQD